MTPRSLWCPQLIKRSDHCDLSNRSLAKFRMRSVQDLVDRERRTFEFGRDAQLSSSEDFEAVEQRSD
jgi:hypothetical protein